MAAIADGYRGGIHKVLAKPHEIMNTESVTGFETHTFSLCFMNFSLQIEQTWFPDAGRKSLKGGRPKRLNTNWNMEFPYSWDSL
jgi:hypothetical protein